MCWIVSIKTKNKWLSKRRTNKKKLKVLIVQDSGVFNQSITLQPGQRLYSKTKFLSEQIWLVDQDVSGSLIGWILYKIYNQWIFNYSRTFKPPFTLQAVPLAVTRVWWNVPVLGSPSGIRMRPCESVVNRPLPCTSCGSFKPFKISASDYGIMCMCRTFRVMHVWICYYGNRRCGPWCT